MDSIESFPYLDRYRAGEHLLSLLMDVGFRVEKEGVFLAVAHGGALVGLPVARGLRAPLGLVYLRKLPHPWNPEMGFGVVTHDGRVLLNEKVLKDMPIPRGMREDIITRVKEEVERRWETYRDASPVSEKAYYSGSKLILVDDGLATGYTMLRALQSVREKNR